MGATWVDTYSDAKDFDELQKHFEDLKMNAIENFGCNPYSGSWNTIDRLVIDATIEYDDFVSARNRCELTAQKWDFALAVPLKPEAAGGARWLIGGWAAE